MPYWSIEGLHKERKDSIASLFIRRRPHSIIKHKVIFIKSIRGLDGSLIRSELGSSVPPTTVDIYIGLNCEDNREFTLEDNQFHLYVIYDNVLENAISNYCMSHHEFSSTESRVGNRRGIILRNCYPRIRILKQFLWRE